MPRATSMGAGLLAAALCIGTAVITSARAADFQPRALKIGYGVTEDHPFGIGVNRFAELLAQKSGGQMKARGYANGQLGAEVASVASTQGGVIEMAVTSTSSVIGNVKDFALVDLPYLFQDEAEVDAILDGPVGQRLLDRLDERNLVGLCFWESGFRNLTNNRRPVTKLEDVAGLKIRTIQSPVFLDTVNALGANAVPLPFTELYSALETGAVDGQEGPFVTILLSKQYEVQKYLSTTRHIYGGVVVLVGRKFWDRLGPAERTAMRESCTEARTVQRRATRELNAKSLVDLQARGMVVTELTPDERERFRRKVAPAFDRHAAGIDPALMQQTRAALELLRRK